MEYQTAKKRNGEQKRKNEDRVIRTPNLLIWNQTRYRCAMPSTQTNYRHTLPIPLSLHSNTNNTSLSPSLLFQQTTYIVHSISHLYFSLRIRRANCISLGMIVTRLA